MARPPFIVHRDVPILVPPASQTPHEFKPLSDIDDQDSYRYHLAVFYIYHSSPSSQGKDPAKVIREALAKALVFYYPLAGRLREVQPTRKLIVECTGEGALFLEADVDVELDVAFGKEPRPPFPCLDELVYNVEGSSGIVDCPLVLAQVTRFKCGGFTLSIRINHTLADGLGHIQIIKAIAELAKGNDKPSIIPLWARELLTSRNPPLITHQHPEYDYDTVEKDPKWNISKETCLVQSFFFGPKEISALRQNNLPPHLQDISWFDLLAATLWRCRTSATSANNPEEEARVQFVIDVRRKFVPALPKGYYGNALANTVAKCKAGELCKQPLEYAVELVSKAKLKVDSDFVKSMMDFLVMKRRPHFKVGNTFLLTDATRAGAEDVDFGWGKAAYGAPTISTANLVANALIRQRSEGGDDGIVAVMKLPDSAMQRFAAEIEKMIKGSSTSMKSHAKSMRSSL